MELVCALVLTFVSLVSPTPHGYGVKGGAIAKADARAVAGSFGGDGYGAVPLSIPNAAGYSGSYSKSSASSFASSSASASSSSFSYSGSGSLGANGLPGSSSSGITGCTSGSCGVSGGNGIPIPHGAGNGLAFGGAKASAAAGAVGIVGSPAYSENGNQAPCVGDDCSKKSPSNCEGTNCNVGASSSSETSSAIYDSKNKCATGQCGQTSSSENEPNDIPVNISGSAGSKSTYNSNDQTSKDDKTSPGNTVSGTSGATASAQNQPSTYLTAPKLGAACTSPNCKSPTESSYENLPSSYNVPIHGTYPSSSSQEKGPCTSGNCGTGPTNASGTTYQGPSAPSSSGGCTSGNCGVYPTSPSKTQSNSQVTSPTYSATRPSASPDCGTTNCAGISSSQPSVVTSSTISKYPSGTYSGALSNTAFSNTGAAAGAYAPPGSYSAPKPTGISSTNPKLPPYTGGFGGPPGILKPNDFSTPVSSAKPIFVPLESHTPVPCSSGNCGSVPSQSKPAYDQSSFSNKPTSPAGIYNPTSCTTGNCGTTQIYHNPTGSHKPTSPAGGFGGPSGILTPSTGTTSNYKPSAPTGPSACSSGTCGSQPDFSSPQSGSPAGIQYKPSATEGTYNPTSCSFGNCGNQPAHSSPQYNPSGPSKPIAPGFGAPAGVLKPNEFNSPSNVPTSSYKPTSPGGTSVCSSVNCESQAGFSPSSAQYNPSGPSKPIAPGFGAPAGVLKPNEFSSPSNVPTSSFKPTSQGGTSACSSGNCVSQADFSPSSPQYNPSGPSKPIAPGFGAPAGVLKPNEFNSPSNVPTSSYKPTSPGGTSACSSGNCGSQAGFSPPSPQYNPSGPSKPIAPLFGAPAGVLKPNEFNSPSNVPTSSYKPISTDGTSACSSGNCGSQSGFSSPHYDQSSSPSGSHYKPGVSAGSYNQVTCSFGECGNQPSLPLPKYSPSGPSKPGASVSGFGAPTGVLAPANVPTIDYKPGTPTGPQNTVPCSFGNCGPQSGQASSSFTTAPQGSYNPSSCSSGNCASQPKPTPSRDGQRDSLTGTQYKQTGTYNSATSCLSGNCGSGPGPSPDYSQSSLPSGAQQKPLAPAVTSNPSCPSGNCGSLPGHSTSQYGHSGVANAANAFAGAVASANAVAYTGGFGGPPGILTPYDNGKIVTTGTTGFGGKFPVGSQLGVHHGLAPSTINTSYGKSFNGVSTGTLAGAGAQASAVAGATAGVYGAGSNNGGNHSGNNYASGCNGGCGANDGGIEAANVDLINALRAGSAAKSISGSYGQGGSFASSSASAHASAGAAVKGYGR